MITMRQEEYRRGYYLPDLKITKFILQDEEIKESSDVGKQLIKHYTGMVMIDGVPIVPGIRIISQSEYDAIADKNLDLIYAIKED